MTGTHHLVGGAALLLLAESATLAVAPAVHDAVAASFALLPPWPLPFLLGCLLPDVDSPGSLAGRVVRLPLEHRTWSHSLWPSLALALLAWLVPPSRTTVVPLVAGMLSHLALDAVSVAGVCWLYPWPGFRRYESDAFVKRSNLHRRLFRWYRTGRRSESIVLALVCAAAVVMAVLARV